MKRIAFVVGLVVTLVSARTHGAPAQDAVTMLRAALGGDAVLNAVRTIRVRGKIKVKPYDDHFDIAVAFPDRFVKTMRTMRRGDFNWSTEWGYIPGQWQPRLEPMLVGGNEETYTHVSGFNGDVLLPMGRNVYRSPEDIARSLDARARGWRKSCCRFWQAPPLLTGSMPRRKATRSCFAPRIIAAGGSSSTRSLICPRL